MRVPPPRLRAFVAVAAVSIGACADATAPSDPALRAFSGTFVLRSVDGAPLPVLRLDYSTTRQYLTADTLITDGRGGYTRVTVMRTDSVGRSSSATERQPYAGTYAVRGDTIDFPASCPPGALCVRPPVGWRMADGSLVIAYRFTQGVQSVALFTRVR